MCLRLLRKKHSLTYAELMVEAAFWKMHGAGNDFLVLEPPPDFPTDNDALSNFAVRACDRHHGVGADGMILVFPSERADRRMKIINADGSEAEMCVNGIRCFVKYCFDRALVNASDGLMTVDTLNGVIQTEAVTDSDGLVCEVRVTLPPPEFDMTDVGVQIAKAPPVIDFSISITKDNFQETFPVTLVSIGNPHAVRFLEQSLQDYPLNSAGPLVECHPMFANRTNYEVVRVQDRTNLSMRVWERGVGETLACGSGACAAVVAARLRGVVDDKVAVTVPGGVIHIEWPGEGMISLSGPAKKVFEAVFQQ